MEYSEVFKIVGIVLLTIWIVPSILCLLLGILLCVCGFGEEGVRMNSLATKWQSMIGNVLKGSLFAVFQSLGATCSLILVPTLILAGVGAVLGVVYYYCYYLDCDCVFKEFIANRTSNANITTIIGDSFEIIGEIISQSNETIKNNVSMANITTSL